MMAANLTLKKALKMNRLGEFADQEEARGIGPVCEPELADAIKHVIKPPQSKDRTSRSASRGDSSEM